MDNIKNDAYYLRKIAIDIEFILEHTKEITEEELEENEVLMDSVMFRLIQISENTGKLTEDFKKRYSSIPWQAIKGMRNRIVHEYGDVELSIIYDKGAGFLHLFKNSFPLNHANRTVSDLL